MHKQNSPRVTNCHPAEIWSLWSLLPESVIKHCIYHKTHFHSKPPSCHREESLYRRRERLSLQYAIKLKSTPSNPTFDTVFRPKYSEIFAIRPNAIPTFGLRIKDLIDEANINIETIRQATIPESPPWQLESQLIDHQFLYTDGSKDDYKVGCAVVSNFNIVKRRLPGQASIYTAELCAIQLALDLVNNSNEDKYIICVDSLSCLQAIEQQHIDHPLVLDVLEKYSALINKTVLFCWVPSHVWIRGNELADAAAKAALNETLTIMTFVTRFVSLIWHSGQLRDGEAFLFMCVNQGTP